MLTRPAPARSIDDRLLGYQAGVRSWLALAVACGCLAALAAVGQALAISAVVAGVFLGNAALADVVPLLGLLVLLAPVRAALAWGADAAAVRASLRLKARLRADLSARLLELGPAWSERERSGDLAHLLAHGLVALDAYLTAYLPARRLAVAVPIMILVIVLLLDPPSTLVLVFTGPILVLLLAAIGGRVQAMTDRRYAELRWMSAFFLDMLQGLPTLKLFGRSAEQAEAIEEVSRRHGETTMEVLRTAFQTSLVLEWGGAVAVALVAVEISLRLMTGTIAFGPALAVLIIVPEFFLPLRQLATWYHSGAAGRSVAGRVFELLDTVPAVRSGRGPQTSNGQTSSGQARDVRARDVRQQGGEARDGEARDGEARDDRQLGGEVAAFSLARPTGPAIAATTDIRFEDVSVRYPDRAEPALRGLDLVIPTAQSLALVGPSGAGKTTVARLLLRFIEPDGGTIRVGDASLSSIDLAAWRAGLAWVSQRPYLFHGTIADNIRLARPEAGDDEVQRAARDAGLDEFVEARPLGYATPIGEGGLRLSGGQRQRLALARAFLLDARLVILDEATSQLDDESEQRITEAIRRLARGRSVLVISHRLRFAASVDRVAVLEAGRVVELGAPRELLTRDGPFSRLVRASEGDPGWLDGEPGTATAARAWRDEPAMGPALPLDGLPVREPPTPIGPGGPEPGPPVGPRRVLRRMLGLLGREGRWIGLGALLGFLAVGSNVALMAMSSYLISKSAVVGNVAEVALAVTAVRVLAISRAGFRYLERLVTHRTTFRVLTALRVWFFRSIEPLAPARLATARSGDLLARVVADIETLEDLYARVVVPPVVALLVIAFASLLLGALDPRLGLVLLAFLVSAVFAVPLATSRGSRAAADTAIGVRAELSAHAVDEVQGLADLVALDHSEQHRARLLTLGQGLDRLQGRVAIVRSAGSAASLLLAGLAGTAVLAVASGLVAAGSLDGVLLAVVPLTAITSFEVVGAVSESVQLVGSNRRAAARLFEIIDSPPPVLEPQTESPAPVDAGIEIEGLTFRYLAEDPPALEELDLRIPSGARVAIVGPSGSGKSTLVNLLARFWDCKPGEIRLGGHDVRDYRPDDARRLLAVVPQEIHLFNATIRDNLALADADLDDERMVRACRIAQAHDFIAALPGGYDTRIGENGLLLSGGERQRLGIARALLRDAPILVLDEATSQLDAATERRLLDSLEPFMATRTTILVTHREAVAARATTVIRLEAGRVRSTGAGRSAPVSVA